MSWVIRKLERWGGHPPAMVPRYFTGAGFPRTTARDSFSYRHWAEGMLATLRRCGVGTTAKLSLCAALRRRAASMRTVRASKVPT